MFRACTYSKDPKGYIAGINSWLGPAMDSYPDALAFAEDAVKRGTTNEAGVIKLITTISVRRETVITNLDGKP